MAIRAGFGGAPTAHTTATGWWTIAASRTASAASCRGPSRIWVTTSYDCAGGGWNGRSAVSSTHFDDSAFVSYDLQRETHRAALGERYRTLLGHLRHEIGHHLWARLIPLEKLPNARWLFGDEGFDARSSDAK